jgi:ABC-type glycerol-3-phosphate transport system permease component
MATTKDQILTQTSDVSSMGIGKSSSERMVRSLIYVLLILGTIVMVAPFLFLISSSLKVETQVFEYPIRWIPDPVRWMNYVESLTYKPFHIYFKNTMIIAVLNQVAILVTASFCAYGFARIRFPGRDLWFGIALATMMLPYFVTMVPQFIIFSRLGWMDSFKPLTIPYFFGGGAFNIFLFRQFFRTFPEELADAARIDGASEFGIFWRIFVPLATPAYITVAIFTFLFSWNDFIGPLLYINSPEKFTVAIGLATYRSALGVGRTRWDLLMAASVAMTTPIVFLFFVLQRYFIKGVVMTGIKG